MWNWIASSTVRYSFNQSRMKRKERQPVNTTKKASARELKPQFPSLEYIQQELGKAQSVDDFFGKEGILSRLFANIHEVASYSSQWLPSSASSRYFLFGC